MIKMRKMPQLTKLLLCGLASLPSLALIGCASSAKNAEEAAKVQRALQHAADVQAIQNLMNKHAYYFATGQHQRELDELWAMTTQGVSWGSDQGFWVDAKELKEHYVQHYDKVRAQELATFGKAHPEVKNAESYSAAVAIFQNATPIIEIAENGETAKGLWYPVSQVTQAPGGKQTPAEGWEAYGVDFYKPNQEWKIWHFFVHRDGSAVPALSETDSPPSVKPTLEPRNSPFATKTGFLKAPQPYRAFSLTFTYGPPDNR